MQEDFEWMRKHYPTIEMKGLETNHNSSFKFVYYQT